MQLIGYLQIATYEIKMTFVWDYFDKETLFFHLKKSIFIYLDNFLKIMRISKKSIKIDKSNF